MATHRIEKINSLIQRELSQIISREIDFPQGLLVTVTGVETLPDLSLAKIWLSIFPVQETKNVIKILNKRIGYLQRLLNKRLIMRPLPRIKFFVDTAEERAAKVEDLLDDIANN